jgi:hypothetical protein
MWRDRMAIPELWPVLLFIFYPMMLCEGQTSLDGRWEGTVKIPDRELSVIVDVAQPSAGSCIGSIIIPGLDVKGATLSEISLHGSDVMFRIKTALASEPGGTAEFKGHLSANGVLAGDFRQAGNAAPFTMTRIGPAQVELPPRSTEVTSDMEGEWKGEYELFGYARHVTIKLANHGSEGATAEFVVVGRKTNNLPVDVVTEEGDLLTISSQQTGINYEGRLDRKTGEIKGTLTQGPIELPLVLHRQT